MLYHQTCLDYATVDIKEGEILSSWTQHLDKMVEYNQKRTEY